MNEAPQDLQELSAVCHDAFFFFGHALMISNSKKNLQEHPQGAEIGTQTGFRTRQMSTTSHRCFTRSNTTDAQFFDAVARRLNQRGLMQLNISLNRTETSRGQQGVA